MKIAKYLLAVALGLVAFIVPKAARADDFTFSFTNTTGNVSGTVTGEIFDLVDNSTSSATDVILTGFPAGLNSTVGSAPVDALTALPSQQVNTFTEVNGTITSADLDLVSFVFPQGGQVASELELALNPGGFTGQTGFLELDGAAFTNFVSSNAITFSAVSAVPEPNTVSLMAAGFLGLMGIGLYKKTTGIRREAC